MHKATPSWFWLILWLGVGSSACNGCGATQRTDGGSGLLPVGHAVTELSAQDQRGQAVRLTPPLAGYTVVYFYPKDGTPGCTAEACAFRDVWERYQKAQVVVYGVSADDAESHERFAKEQALPFSLIADTNALWAKAFGVPGVGGYYSRVTFLLAPDARVVKVYDDIDPGLHANQILADVRALTSGGAK